jgi:bifunctional non-homologous end joining protein LigD
VSPLGEYRRKRNFSQTTEPAGKIVPSSKDLSFVVQKHAATRLHYDLRLELEGVLKSWAVPKGPSLNPGEKRLAIEVEDHPLSYRNFEGTIPKGNYGAGEVIVWDTGTYKTVGSTSSQDQLLRGEWKFELFGKKLRGGFVLVRLKRSPEKKEWLLIKHRDEAARPDWDAESESDSVLSSRSLPSPSASQQKMEQHTPPGAVRSKFPEKLPVTLAELGKKPFSDPQWVFEVKWDGVRVLVYVQGSSVKVFSRSGREMTAEFPEVQEVAAQLRANTAVLDGEVVVLDSQGRSEFHTLQDRLGVQNPSLALRQKAPITCYFFDLLYLQGFDVRNVPLLARKELLKQTLVANDVFRFSGHQPEQGEALFREAQKHGVEGLVAKKIDSLYSGNRTPNWIKLKVVSEVDAVVAGWTEPRRSRKYFGALVLGLYDGKNLKFIGSVGTGFPEAELRRLFKLLETLPADHSPFQQEPSLPERVHWIRPELVARIKFSNWTRDFHLRMPVFLGIRKDRLPSECTFADATSVPNQPHTPIKTEKPARKVAAKVNASISRSSSSEKRGFGVAIAIAQKIRASESADLQLQIHGHPLRLSHLSKIYFPSPRITKGHLLAYYAGIASYVLPFLRDRPLVLRRYPNGLSGKPFFQKEAPKGLPNWVATANVYSDERQANMAYVMADNLESLLYLTNLGCIDHNPWSSRAESQESPDYLFFDLDPTPDTNFAVTLEIARAIQKLLTLIGLRCFLKTSGATGFHIFVPLKAGYRYEDTRRFAEIVTQSLDLAILKHVTMQRTVSRRPNGAVMIDALQNARGKPLASAYSVRATVDATVSTPVTEKELQAGFDPLQFTLKSLPHRLAKIGDLWADFFELRQSLEDPLSRLYHLVKKRTDDR